MEGNFRPQPPCSDEPKEYSLLITDIPMEASSNNELSSHSHEILGKEMKSLGYIVTWPIMLTGSLAIFHLRDSSIIVKESHFIGHILPLKLVSSKNI